LKCKNIIEIEKKFRKGKHEKKEPFVPVARPGIKGHPLLSRTGVPGWEIGTAGVFQPGQINVFVVVLIKHQYISACIANKICRPIKAKADRCMKARHVSIYIILVANKQVLFVSICARTPNIISWKQIKFGVYASSPWLA